MWQLVNLKIRELFTG